MPERDAPTILVSAGGAVDTALLPYRLVHLRAHYDVRLFTALTRGALQFVTTAAMQGITGTVPYTEGMLFHPVTGRSIHLQYAECDLMVVSPATARLVVQFAQGEVTCPVSRVFAFADKKKIIVVPAIHQRMTPRLYERHLQVLREVGCCVVSAPTGSGWAQVEELAAARLSLSRRTQPSEVMYLDTAE